MSYFQNLSLELIEAILDYLDVKSLENALRIAKFLQYPSERRLYYTVALWTERTSSQGLGLEDRQAIFLNTVFNNDLLARHVVRLALGGYSTMEVDSRVNGLIGGSMKKMINIKKLALFGYPYILHGNLHSLPFALTSLIISIDTSAYTALDLPLLSILRAHPNLKELDLGSTELPSDLVEVLKAEQDGSSHESGILCPHLKRFDGYNETLRFFLPMRTIERGATIGSGTEYIRDDNLPDFWLTPTLIKSYQHLRVLEVSPEYDADSLFLSTIAPYLTSLTHFRAMTGIHTQGTEDHLLESLGRMPALKCFTLRVYLVTQLATVETALEVVRRVCGVCPDIAEIFVQGRDGTEMMYYHYLRGEGLQSSLASDEAAFGSHDAWLHES